MAAWDVFRRDVQLCKQLDLAITKKELGTLSMDEVSTFTEEIIHGMREEYLDALSKKPIEDLSDEFLSKLSRYTDGVPLKPFENALDLVPELVNLVSLADALPLDGSPLPLNLKKIACRCKGAIYYAPRRFTAVQFPYDEPRSRVLLFHTGRLVGTGCDSPAAAKLAVIRALKSISEDAGIQIGLRRFCVINQVGAITLGARLDCNKFADVHSATSHYDAKSFVGLAWRPFGEAICSEIYSTGKSNLPGSRRERQLLRSFSRMAPELLRLSEKPELATRFSAALRAAHRPSEKTLTAPRAETAKRLTEEKEQKKRSLWDDDEELLPAKRAVGTGAAAVEATEADLELFGELFDTF